MDETSRHAGEVNRDGNGDGRKAKGVLRIRACLTASIAFAFLSVGSAQTQSLKPLKFGHCQVAPEVIAVWIANELGIFQKYRLKVELTHVAGATLGQAMAAGEIPIGFCAGARGVGGRDPFDFQSGAGKADKVDLCYRELEGSPSSRQRVEYEAFYPEKSRGRRSGDQSAGRGGCFH